MTPSLITEAILVKSPISPLLVTQPVSAGSFVGNPKFSVLMTTMDAPVKDLCAS